MTLTRPRSESLAGVQRLFDALEMARPFVIQYGNNRELAQIDAAIDGFVPAPGLGTTQVDGESGASIAGGRIEAMTNQELTELGNVLASYTVRMGRSAKAHATEEANLLAEKRAALRAALTA